MANMNYWYDGQIRRYLIQLIRVFSHFEVAENTSDGVVYNRVPCKYASSNRMVAQLLRSNSENIVNSAPQITVALRDIAIARDRAQEPFYTDTRQVAERKWDTDNGAYTSEQGNLYTVHRYMPVPYNLTIQVDIWTTNTDSKMQLLEQIMVLFNPSIQLQSNDNPLDWSNVFEIELTNVDWTSRSLPQGVEDVIDIATMTFEVPVWISPPAKVTRQKIIQKIIADVYSVTDTDQLNYSQAYYDFFSSIPESTQIVVAPGDYLVEIIGNQARLIDNADQSQTWSDIIEMQGELTEVSRLEFNLSNDARDLSQLVIGAVSAAADPGVLDFTLDADTLPSNTLANVLRIVDPRSSQPGTQLPASAVGQRYLITESVQTDDAFSQWGTIDAAANDIIEYTGTVWQVVFDSASQTDQAWVTNTFSNEQYRWTGTEWISSWQGVYNSGYWRLIL
jgi:hypothetical protein